MKFDHVAFLSEMPHRYYYQTLGLGKNQIYPSMIITDLSRAKNGNGVIYIPDFRVSIKVDLSIEKARMGLM